MVEVEVKMKLNSKRYSDEDVVSYLLKQGFEEGSFFREEDRYFDNAEQQIRNTDSAMRIRIVTDLNAQESFAQLNFKGKRMDTVSMSRPEFETQVMDANAIEQILNHLGYAAVEPKVVKIRRELVKEDMTACLDQVEGLGTFLELEIVVDDETQKEYALEMIEQLAARLGDMIAERTNVSYLSQLQCIQKEAE